MNEIYGTLTVIMLIETSTNTDAKPRRATIYRQHGITEAQARDRLRDLRGANKALCGRHVSAEFQPFPVDLTTD